MLYEVITFVDVAKGEIGFDIDGVFLARAQADQRQLEALGHLATAEPDGHRLVVEIVLEHVAVGQAEAVVQGDGTVTLA